MVINIAGIKKKQLENLLYALTFVTKTKTFYLFVEN